MSLQLNPTRRSDCPLNVSLEIFGDRWSLLIVRDLMFKGSDGYSAFLQSRERIATNILADRLKRLEASGIIEKLANTEDSRRASYRLTSKGFDLTPVILEMMVWAARYENTTAPPVKIDHMTEHHKNFVAEFLDRMGASELKSTNDIASAHEKPETKLGGK